MSDTSDPAPHNREGQALVIRLVFVGFGLVAFYVGILAGAYTVWRTLAYLVAAGLGYRLSRYGRAPSIAGILLYLLTYYVSLRAGLLGLFALNIFLPGRARQKTLADGPPLVEQEPQPSTTEFTAPVVEEAPPWTRAEYPQQVVEEESPRTAAESPVHLLRPRVGGPLRHTLYFVLLSLGMLVIAPHYGRYRIGTRRRRVAYALRELEKPRERDFALRELARLRDPAAAQRVIQGLLDGQTGFDRAIETLVAIGEGALEPMLSGLDPASPALRRKLLDAIAQIARPIDATSLIPHLRDADGLTRFVTVKTLSAVARPSAQMEAALEQMLEDEYPLVPPAAGRALAAARLQTSVEACVALLDHKDVNVRIGAAKLLGDTGAAASSERLELLALDDDAAVARAAIVALGRIGDPAVASLQRLLDADAVDTYVRGWVVIALAACMDAVAWTAIEAVTRDADDGVARLARLAVEQHASPTNEDPWRRSAAAAA